MKRIWITLALIVALVSSVVVATSRTEAQLPPDYDLQVPGGAHFYT